MVGEPAGGAVFVDTSAWYALADTADTNHDRAKDVYDRLKGALSHFVSTDWVLLETTALLHRRAGAVRARATVQIMARNSEVELVWLDEELGRLALERYHSAAKTVSLVDAGSFTVMERLKIRRAFAFDEDFRTQGYDLE